MFCVAGPTTTSTSPLLASFETQIGSRSEPKTAPDLSRPLVNVERYARQMNEALPEHVAENRRYWNAMAQDWVTPGERRWAQDACWGTWAIPNSELALLADDMTGNRAIELGCGTGYVSAWMRRRGASVYAIDNSEGQLMTARRLCDVHQLDGI